MFKDLRIYLEVFSLIVTNAKVILYFGIWQFSCMWLKFLTSQWWHPKGFAMDQRVFWVWINIEEMRWSILHTQSDMDVLSSVEYWMTIKLKLCPPQFSFFLISACLFVLSSRGWWSINHFSRALDCLTFSDLFSYRLINDKRILAWTKECTWYFRIVTRQILGKSYLSLEKL